MLFFICILSTLYAGYPENENVRTTCPKLTVPLTKEEEMLFRIIVRLDEIQERLRGARDTSVVNTSRQAEEVTIPSASQSELTKPNNDSEKL